MTKFETANELISFIKENDMKSGFYKKGRRIQYLIGFDSMGMMSVTTPSQVEKRNFKSFRIISYHIIWHNWDIVSSIRCSNC